MSQNPLDQTQDITERETHRLTTLFTPPAFVKNASRDRTHATPDLPRHVYADQFNKLYPCHTAAATWLSSLFFADKRANFDEKTASAIYERLQSSAKYFGISGLISELEEKVAASGAVDVDALPDDAFAIVWVGENGTKERHWPLRNATEVKFAAAHFEKYRDEFVFADRQRIAEKILEKAAAFDADISNASQMLATTAGHGACAAATTADMLHDRARLVARSNAAAGAELTKLAEAVAANPEQARAHDTRLKIASAVDAFDRENKLQRLYDAGGLPRAEEVLFAVTEKVAREFLAENVETTTGNVYALSDLEKIAVDDFRNWMGDEFADAVSAGGVYVDRDKLAAIVPTLDRGMASTLDRMLQESKVAAVAQAPETSDMLPLEKLFELAAQA
jgi:hypothetical protein